MTQIVVTLEEGSNDSIIRNAIELIKGVKNAIITHIDTDKVQKHESSRMRLFDQLAGSISLNNIDISDDRTNYLLNK